MTEPLAATYTCPTCGRVSHHPADARHRFCAVCGFESDPLTRRLARRAEAALRAPPAGHVR